MDHFKLKYTRSRRQKFIMSIAAVLVFVTTYALILPAITIDIDTAENEPGMDVSTVGDMNMPALSLREQHENVDVSVEAGEGVFPAGTALFVDQSRSDAVQFMLEATVESRIERYQAVSISFENEGVSVSPQGNYNVRIITDFVDDFDEFILVSLQGEVANIVPDAVFTYNQVEFSTHFAGIFAVVRTSPETIRTLNASGALYEASVSFDYDARLPDGTRLEITELDHDSGEYADSQRMFEKAENGETEGEDRFTDIIDLTLYAPDDSVVEPAASVQVSIKRKNLPEDFTSDDGGLIVQHLDESGKKPVVEIMDSAVILSRDTLTASFETESFSSYRLRWNNGNRYATIHYGYMENGQFVEFDDAIPAHKPDYINTSNYTSSSYSYLIHDIPGYNYSKTMLNRPDSSGTQITPLLAYNNGWRYTTNFVKEQNLTNTNSAFTALPNTGGNIYVIYEPDTIPYTDGGTATMYETPVEDPDEPMMHKTSTNNHDGTRTITLSVDGHASPIMVEKLADVIVVFDISGSMDYDMNGNSTNVTADKRITIEKNAIKDLAEQLLDSPDFINAEGRRQIRMSLLTFSNTAQYLPLSQTDDAIYDPPGNTNLWQPYPDYNFTTDSNKFKGLVDSIDHVAGGTNWEHALQLANEMPVDPERGTYIIFVTDGNPTFRVTRDPTTAVTDARMQNDCDENYYREFGVFGHGSDDPYDYNYAAAVNAAADIVDKGKNLYCIGVSTSVDLVDPLCVQSGAGENHSFIATNQEELESAFADIKASITGHVGWSQVTVTDGITPMTNLVAKTKVVGASDELTYRKVYKDENGNVIRTVPDWDPTSEGCNEAVYDSATGSIVWNMGDDFVLEDNVTYEVSFRVWPNQRAIDIVTLLNNKQITIDDLSPEERDQFKVVENGGYTYYTLKTNTDAGLTYTPTREEDNRVTYTGQPKYTACNDQVEPLLMETMEMVVTKQFEDSFADETGNGVGADRPKRVVLYLESRLAGTNDPWTPVNVFKQDDETYSNRIVLSGNKWTSDVFYVAPGLTDSDDVTREAGHEYRILEEDLNYHYELDPEVINPMMQGYANTNDNLPYDQGLLVGRQVYIVKTYKGDKDQNLDLTAINAVKGGIDIQKRVVGSSGAQLLPNESFTFRGEILDPDGNPYIFDPANDDRTDYSQSADETTPLFNAHQNDPIPYHIFARNGDKIVYKGHFADTSDITFTIRAGESLRFPLVPIGSTFRFWEVDGNGMPTGYYLESAEGILQEKEPNPVTGIYEVVTSDETDRFPTTDSQNRISGTVYGNRVDALTFTNRSVVPGKIVVRKAVVKSDLTTEIYPEGDLFTFTGYIRERYRVGWSYQYRGYSLDYNIRDKDGGIVTTGHINDTYNNLTFYLEAGQFIEFLDVPNNAQYQFSEQTSGMSSDYSFVGATASAASSVNGSVTQPSVSNAGVVSGTMHTNEEHSSVFKNKIAHDPVPLQMIKVYAKDTTERINGATFMLYNDAAHNNPATDYQGNEIGPITTGGYLDSEETQPLGFARIGELWPGTYYLVETVTPNGYRQPSDHMVITISNDGTVTLNVPDNASATGSGFVTENGGIVTVAIPNSKIADMVLPRTGGSGTWLLYLSGGLFVFASAALIYIFRFRQRKGGKRRPDFP